MRAVRNLLIVLVVLLVVLVAIDRVGAWVAQGVVADQVEAELASNEIDSEPPEVSFDEAPFLTQVLAGRYESVTLRLRNVGTSGVRLPVLELTAYDVTASMGTLISQEGPIVAEHLTGTGTIGYEAVELLTEVEGLELSAGEGGALRVRVPTDDGFGNQVVLVGTAEVTADQGEIRVRPNELAAEDSSDVPPGADALIGEIAQDLSVDVPLPPLPYDLTVDSVRAEPGGLAVSASAEDVPLSS